MPSAVSSSVQIDRFYLQDDLLQTQTILLIVFFFVTFLVHSDYSNFGLAPLFFQTVWARLVFLVITLMTFFGLRHIHTPLQHNYVLFLWSCCYIALSIYINILRPAGNINFTYVDILVVMSLYVVLPNQLWLKALLAVLLTSGDLAVIIFLKSPMDDLSLKTIILSYVIANVLGIVISGQLRHFRRKHYHIVHQQQALYAELEHTAFIDYLTGTLNRRKFFQLGIEEFEVFSLYKKSFVIIILDLDLFKQLNDSFGHDAGDYYLQEFTNMVLENTRSTDALGRLGGEEFALLLPATSLPVAMEIAETLRRLCEERRFAFKDHQLHTTVSIGLTTVLKKDRTFQDVLKRADEALYQAKGNGRNQVYLKVKEI